MFCSLFYWAFTIADHHDRDEAFNAWILLPSFLLAAFGFVINFYLCWRFNDNFIAQNLTENSELIAINSTDDLIEENKPIVCLQPVTATLALSADFLDYNSLMLAAINTLNTLFDCKIPLLYSLPAASIFYLPYSPSSLPKLEQIAPDFICNPITRIMAKHPNFFSLISTFFESFYDLISALVAIPAFMYLALADFNLPLTLMAIGLISIISYVSLSTENFLFERINVKNTFAVIAGDSKVLPENDPKIILPGYQVKTAHLALYNSLAIVSLMLARPVSTTLSLIDDLDPLIHTLAVIIVSLIAGVGHYFVTTKSAQRRLETQAGDSCFSSGITWFRQHCCRELPENDVAFAGRFIENGCQPSSLA